MKTDLLTLAKRYNAPSDSREISKHTCSRLRQMKTHLLTLVERYDAPADTHDT